MTTHLKRIARQPSDSLENFLDSAAARPIRYEFFDHLHCGWNRFTNVLAETHHAVSIQSRRLAADEIQISRMATKRSNHLQHPHWRQGMRIDNFISAGVNLLRVELEQINGSRFFATRRCVDEERGIVTIHDGVSEIVSANPEVNDVHALRPRSLQQFRRHFTAKGVVAKKDVPDSGDEEAFHFKCIG